MDAQLRKETVTMEQVTAHGASQAVVEGEITLPGGLLAGSRGYTVVLFDAAEHSGKRGRDGGGGQCRKWG